MTPGNCVVAAFSPTRTLIPLNYHCIIWHSLLATVRWSDVSLDADSSQRAQYMPKAQKHSKSESDWIRAWWKKETHFELWPFWHCCPTAKPMVALMAILHNSAKAALFCHQFFNLRFPVVNRIFLFSFFFFTLAMTKMTCWWDVKIQDLTLFFPLFIFWWTERTT